MKQNFFHSDFEDYLKRNADQCRIIPSADLWNNIAKSMAYKRSRLSIVLSMALLFSSLLASYRTNLYTHLTGSTKPAAVTAVKLSVKELRAESNAIRVVAAPVQIAAAHPKQNNPVAKNTATQAIIFSPDPLANESNPVEALAYNHPNQFNTNLSLPPLFNLVAPPSTADNNQVVKVIKPKSSKHKTSFQFVFTPTVSYRKLSENKQGPATNNGYITFTGANPIVSQKPSMGLELALLGKRSLSKNIKLFSGLQFNMSHYEVKAVNSMPEFATIALRDGYSYDYVNTISSYRNSNAVNASWLQNLYFQLSVPVGIEATVGNKNTKFGVAGTVQPSYVMADNSYLLSTNYKNYVQAPWLIRRMNVNTSLATFIAYSSGKLNWQVGPQVRYQLLSSFKTKYPIKENLFDYGLRVGVSLAK